MSFTIRAPVVSIIEKLHAKGLTNTPFAHRLKLSVSYVNQIHMEHNFPPEWRQTNGGRHA